MLRNFETVQALLNVLFSQESHIHTHSHWLIRAQFLTILGLFVLSFAYTFLWMSFLLCSCILTRFQTALWCSAAFSLNSLLIWNMHWLSPGLQLSFRTRVEEGLMLFAVSPGEQEEYVALQIHNGRPYFLFDPQVHHVHGLLCVCLSYKKPVSNVIDPNL